jgi:hypothetical protein
MSVTTTICRAIPNALAASACRHHVRRLLIITPPLLFTSFNSRDVRRLAVSGRDSILAFSTEDRL